MAKVIIGIHGLGNKPEADLLEEWWINSIKEGFKKQRIDLNDFNFTLVYWADILHPIAEDPSISDKENELYMEEPYTPSNNQPMPEKEASFFSKILKYAEEQIDNILLKEDMTLNFSGVTDRIIHNYFEDLEIYYSNSCTLWDDPKCMARPAICDRLNKILVEHKNDRVMLIAHSMGSIIAYDVLMNNLKELKIDAFITVGSPLGLPIIISRIFAEQKDKLPQDRLAAPDNILKKWINISDPEDLVAMDHTLNDDFKPNKHGIQAEDVTVYNDYIVGENDNHHKIYGYLRCQEMVSVINTFLKEEIKKFSFKKKYESIKTQFKSLFS